MLEMAQIQFIDKVVDVPDIMQQQATAAEVTQKPGTMKLKDRGSDGQERRTDCRADRGSSSHHPARVRAVEGGSGRHPRSSEERHDR